MVSKQHCRVSHVEAHIMLNNRLPGLRLATRLITVQAFMALCVLGNSG